MSEPTPAATLEADLRSYFALTTSTELPRRVRGMRARSLTPPPARRSAWLVGGTAMAAAALVAVVVASAAHPASPGGAGSSALSTSGKSQNGAAAAPAAAVPIRYPGLDTDRLATAGVRLLPAPAAGAARISAAQAQAAAVASVGTGSGPPGPAVLTLAQVAQPNAHGCLCWAVDVPAGGAKLAAPGTAALHTELVLVDAVTGRVDAVLTGNGIP